MYEGNWKDGKMHGQGIYKLGNGDVYTGSFRKGLYEGKGTLKLNNGDFFQGEFLRGLPGGQMVVKYSNGDVYEGDMGVGKYEGQGTYTYARDLGSYTGGWSLGLFHGKGVRYFSDGSKFVGYFKSGNLRTSLAA